MICCGVYSLSYTNCLPPLFFKKQLPWGASFQFQKCAKALQALGSSNIIFTLPGCSPPTPLTTAASLFPNLAKGVEALSSKSIFLRETTDSPDLVSPTHLSPVPCPLLYFYFVSMIIISISYCIFYSKWKLKQQMKTYFCLHSEHLEQSLWLRLDIF